MKPSQLFTAPNQLTLLRMVFVPFIVIHLVEGRYLWALVVFVIAGFSDGLDGLLARMLHQQTMLGQYLDPIADKLLLSTIFLVLSILRKIPWKYTVVVFSRDISILAASAVLFAIAGLRNFSVPASLARPTLSRRSAPFFSFFCFRFVRCAGYGFCAPNSFALLFSSLSSLRCITSFWCSSACATTRMLYRRLGIPPSDGDLTHFVTDPRIFSSFLRI